MKRFIKSAIACIAAVAMIATVAPVTTQAAAKAVTVTNQKQLEAAIKKGVKKITIKTTKAVKITIPASKKALGIAFVVDAKKATITNKATVDSLTVKAAKTLNEQGKNNDIKITAPSLTLNIAKESKGADIQLAKTGADVKVVAKGNVSSIAVTKKANVKVTVEKKVTVGTVEVAAKDVKVDLTAKGTVANVNVADNAEGADLNITASGAVKNITVDAKAEVAVAGSTTKTVNVVVTAPDTVIKAETKVDTTLHADAKVEIGEGAEGSSVAAGSEDVNVEVKNESKGDVTVSDSTGKETTVESGETTNTEEPKEPTKPTTPPTTVVPGGGSSSSEDTKQYFKKPSWVEPTTVEIYKDSKDSVARATFTKGCDGVPFNNVTYTYEDVRKFIEEAYKAITTDTVGKKTTTISLDTEKTTGPVEINWQTSGVVKVIGTDYSAEISVANNTYTIIGKIIEKKN